jgi:SAM-dependent methyltransferase
MDDPARALAEYRRVLKPGGVALIVEGNRYNPISFLHMTKLLGHEHFPQKHFRRLVLAAFPRTRFGVFEAHYVPGAERLRPLQHLVEEGLERVPGCSRILSYNFAVALR